MSSKMNHNLTSQRQLELELENARAFQIAMRRPQRVSRAQWWFQQMRQVVDQALEWQPASAGRPEQVWLPLPSRRQSA